MANQTTGRIDRITPTVQIPSKDGSKTFLKREITLDATRYDPYTGERGYDNFPTFEFGGDKCSELDGFQIGQVVTVSFDLQGVKYNDTDGNPKYFTKVRGYKVELKQQNAPAQPVQQPQQNQEHQQASIFPPPVDSNGNVKDDLPF